MGTAALVRLQERPTRGRLGSAATKMSFRVKTEGGEHVVDLRGRDEDDLTGLRSERGTHVVSLKHTDEGSTNGNA